MPTKFTGYSDENIKQQETTSLIGNRRVGFISTLIDDHLIAEFILKALYKAFQEQ